MDFLTAIKERHSVRSYLDKPIEDHLREELEVLIDECNREGDLHLQLVVDEPKAFDGFMAHYGKFSGVKNYVALVGKKDADEKIGYYGEKIALKAQTLGLNSCWVALTYKKIKTAFAVRSDEKLYCVLTLGYGANQGVAHKSKAYEEVASPGEAPEWFKEGVQAALLAPTAMNQQKFRFTYENGKVNRKAGFGFYTKIDLGIAKYHFEIGANHGKDYWN